MSSQLKNNDITFTDNATHVYIKVDQPKSLCPRFEGPYEIHSRPSRSTIEVVLGCKKDGSLRLQKYHWSSAKIAHMREGASVAQRPRLGRPLNSSNTPQTLDTALTSSKQSTSSETSSVNSHTSSLGDAAGDTENRQQKPKQSSRGRPIRTSDSASPSNRPITTSSASSAPEPAKIQTRKPPEPVLSSEVFDKWAPQTSRASGNVDLPPRSARLTRNPNPKYI